MDLLNAAVSGAVVSLVGLLLSLQLRGTATGLRREMENFRADMRDVGAELRDLRGEVGAVRTDLTQVALAVGTGPSPGSRRRS